MTASTTCCVVLSPPRSLVLYFPSKITFFTASSSRFANVGNWRCLNIMAEDRSKANGFAVFCSTIFFFPTFPAEAPCSNTACSAPTLPINSHGITCISLSKQYWYESRSQYYLQAWHQCLQQCRRLYLPPNFHKD